MATKPTTKSRALTLPVPPALYRQAQSEATAIGETVSTVLRMAIRRGLPQVRLNRHTLPPTREVA